MTHYPQKSSEHTYTTHCVCTSCSHNGSGAPRREHVEFRYETGRGETTRVRFYYITTHPVEYYQANRDMIITRLNGEWRARAVQERADIVARPSCTGPTKSFSRSRASGKFVITTLRADRWVRRSATGDYDNIMVIGIVLQYRHTQRRITAPGPELGV